MNGQVVEFRRGFCTDTEQLWAGWQVGVMFRQDHRRTPKRAAYASFVPRVSGMAQTPEYNIEHWDEASLTWKKEAHWLQIRLPLTFKAS
jgi:hypothetical protein